jgi:hypothetical protein
MAWKSAASGAFLSNGCVFVLHEVGAEIASRLVHHSSRAHAMFPKLRSHPWFAGRRRSLVASVALALLLSAGWSERLSAGMIAMDSFSATQAFGSGIARGWRFRPEVNVWVTHLSMYDVDNEGGGDMAFDGDGLPGNFDVHLWSDTGTELAVATIGAGSPLFSGTNWRTSAALPTAVALTAGTIYRLSVDYGDFTSSSPEFRSAPTAVSMSSAITLIASTGTAVAALNNFGLSGVSNNVFPNSSNSIEPLGPNLVYETFDPASSSVPEPSSIVLIGTALAAGGVWRFRRKRNVS